VAVRNLMANAVKYTRGRTAARIRVGAVDRAGDGVGLEVSDNGVGFQMAYVGKLFGVFQRLHASEDFEGTGIGLANVRRVVERHGGEVWAHGVPGLPVDPASVHLTLQRVLQERASTPT
jgi:chemotaxis family two-component system sensor kinase Cph1